MNAGGDIIASRSKQALTVQQVIDILNTIEDKTLPVWADGCDCSNPVAGLRIEHSTATITVEI